MLIPLKDKIVIKRDIPEEFKGSIYIRESDREKLNTGLVLAIGPDCKDTEVGNKVIFGKYDGNDYSLDGQVLLIMRENQIWGILNA